MRNIISTSYIFLGPGNLIVAEELHIPPSVCVGTVLWVKLAMYSNPYLWLPVWLTDHPVHQANLHLRTQSWPQAWIQFLVQVDEFPWQKCNLDFYENSLNSRTADWFKQMWNDKKLQGHSEVSLTCKENNDTFSAAKILSPSCFLKEHHILVCGLWETQRNSSVKHWRIKET